jgi:hypothetical protein
MGNNNILYLPHNQIETKEVKKAKKRKGRANPHQGEASA